MNLHATLLASCLFACATARAENPPVYYIRQTLPQGLSLAQINPDGTAEQVLNTGLPQPFGPAWSRDGRLLALTSVNPQRPNKVSQDIFLYGPATGTSRLALLFEDEVTLPPFFENGALVTDRSKFTYRLPIYKTFSPDGTRLAVSLLDTSGFYQGGAPDVNTLTGVSQVPTLQVFRLADGLPQDIVVLGRIRTFKTLGGFGVDWHPTQDVLVAPIDVDAPTDGSFLPSESSALFLLELVPNALITGHARHHPPRFANRSSHDRDGLCPCLFSRRPTRGLLARGEHRRVLPGIRAIPARVRRNQDGEP